MSIDRVGKKEKNLADRKSARPMKPPEEVLQSFIIEMNLWEQPLVSGLFEARYPQCMG